MKNARRFSLLALAAGALLASASVASAEDLAVRGVKPYHGIMLDVGSKQLGGYFAEGEGRCKLTVIIADGYSEDPVPSAATTMRVQMTVDADKPARLDTAEGKAVQFECVNGGQAMNATVLNRLAAN